MHINKCDVIDRLEQCIIVLNIVFNRYTCIYEVIENKSLILKSH